VDRLLAHTVSVAGLTGVVLLTYILIVLGLGRVPSPDERTLLLLSQTGREDMPLAPLPKISQATLADMVGTTRSRVSFFMNRFRKLGFIEYSGLNRIHVNSSLLSVVPLQ